jgi:hypothetical protein
MSKEEPSELDEALQDAGERGLQSQRSIEARRRAEEDANLRDLLDRVEETEKAPAPGLVCPNCGSKDIERRSNMNYKLGACRECGKVFPYAPVRSSLVNVNGKPTTFDPPPDPIEERASRMPAYRDPRKNFIPGED